jgi:hypothetical protein
LCLPGWLGCLPGLLCWLASWFPCLAGWPRCLSNQVAHWPFGFAGSPIGFDSCPDGLAGGLVCLCGGPVGSCGCPVGLYASLVFCAGWPVGSPAWAVGVVACPIGLLTGWLVRLADRLTSTADPMIRLESSLFVRQGLWLLQLPAWLGCLCALLCRSAGRFPCLAGWQGRLSN